MQTPTTINDYAELIDNCTPFTQANYGDGEWQCILGYEGGNVNGDVYGSEIRAALIETLQEPRLTFFGTNPGKRLDEAVTRWRLEHLGENEMRWVYKEILPNANCRGELGGFLAALRRRRVLLVGPEHVTAAVDKLPFDVGAVVTAPLPGACDAIDRLESEITNVVLALLPEVILFSCGMATNVLTHRLVRRLSAAADLIMIDCGAVWDPYVGVFSRKGYQKERFQNECLPRNIERAKA